MTCCSCSGVCQTNNTGICLGCQRGFVNLPQEDAWENSEEREKVKLQDRKKEVENALQESSAKESALRTQSKAGQGVRTPYAKRKKVTQKSEKNYEEESVNNFGPEPGDG